MLVDMFFFLYEVAYVLAEIINIWLINFKSVYYSIHFSQNIN
jgi:hypothetical protein